MELTDEEKYIREHHSVYLFGLVEGEGFKDIHLDGEDLLSLLKEYGEHRHNQAQKHHTELLKSLQVMTGLCKLRYGNKDQDVYAQIQKTERLIDKLK